MRSSSRVTRRYDALARVYDTITIERFVYRAARRDAVELLRLRRGDTVLDVGCGTGASLSLLRHAVGPQGAVIGIDLSPAMLRRARTRVRARGWDNVTLVEVDATRLRPEDMPVSSTPSAALFALSLSVVPNPAAVLQSTSRLLPAGGRIAVLDAGTPPAPGRHARAARLLQPIWRAVCSLAVADPAAHPWSHVPAVAPHDTTIRSHHLGYVRVAAGTITAPTDSARTDAAEIASTQSSAAAGGL